MHRRNAKIYACKENFLNPIKPLMMNFFANQILAYPNGYTISILARREEKGAPGKRDCNLFSVVPSLENPYKSRMKGIFSSFQSNEYRAEWCVTRDNDGTAI